MHARYLSINLRLILFLFLAFILAACRAQASPSPTPTHTPVPPTLTQLPEATITLAAAATAANTPTVASSPTRSPTPTLTPTFTPTITPTPYPPEKLSFIEVTPPVNERLPDYHLVLINSDGTGDETVDFLTPYLRAANPDIPVGDYLEWSPDGRYLAFIGGNGGIDVADFDTQQVAHVDGSSNFGVSWSPDSRHLVVAVSYRRGDERIKGSLFIYDAQTGSMERLTHDDTFDFFPSWSPDGQWIAFLRTLGDTYPCYEEGCDNGLYLIRPDGSDIELLQKNIFSGIEAGPDPAWSPDSQRLVVEGNYDLNFNFMIVSLDGTVINLGMRNYGVDCMANWSPDGSLLVFDSKEGAVDGGADIFIFNFVETELINLTRSPVYESWPRWSKSGRYIAYGYYDAQTNKGSNCIMYADGSNVFCLRPGGRAHSWVPKRQP